MKYISTGAFISDCGTWRYSLWRNWDSFNNRKMIIVGLNPSTANAEKDDNTINRCVNFAKRNGCGGIIMLNLFAFRAREPKDMMAATDPVGPQNDVILRHYADLADQMFVAAWGVGGTFKDRDKEVSRMFFGMQCFGLTKHGLPRHPLFLKSDSPLISFETRR
jgi:hypothetical protein